ncbi:unnamed protein product, partial [Musa acuminata subsp. burmannicoides]
HPPTSSLFLLEGISNSNEFCEEKPAQSDSHSLHLAALQLPIPCGSNAIWEDVDSGNVPITAKRRQWIFCSFKLHQWIQRWRRTVPARSLSFIFIVFTHALFDSFVTITDLGKKKHVLHGDAVIILELEIVAWTHLAISIHILIE